MAHPKSLLNMASDQTGWNEATQIDVLCDFIAQSNRCVVQPNFEIYLDKRVDEELSMSDDSDEDESDPN